MGTRSLTTFIDTYEDEEKKVKKNKIVTMYKQYDGYPDGFGLELAEFLNRGKMVNGIGMDDTTVFNGMSCLAAQVISEFKKGAGGIYLHRGGTTNCWEEYRYEVVSNGEGNPLTFICREVMRKGTKRIFKGTPEEFINKYKDQ